MPSFFALRVSILSAIALLLATALPAQERLGMIVFPNSGKPEAQAAFLRGVALLHSFAYADAAKAFRDAEATDPDFVLAYWGEAMTFNHPIWMEVSLDDGRKALAKLGTRAAPTGRERMYVDAVRLLYSDDPDKASRDAAYEAAMDRLARAYPEDVEAQVFHALSILGTMRKGEPDARKQIRAAAILEPLFPSHLDHPGVLHYLIHAYDDPIHAPLGLRAARLYANVAPAAPHALHMPSHIFVQLGLWDDVVHSNEAAWAASGKHDFHSLEWLQYAYLQLHRFDDAKRLLDQIEGTSEREMHARDNMMVRYSIETGDWNAFDFATVHASRVTVFARGLQALARRRIDDAVRASKELEQFRTAKDTGYDSNVVSILQRELDGLTHLARGEQTAGLASLKSAADEETLLGAPSGPAETIKPPIELYAEELLKSGKKKEAAALFRESLLRTPNRAASVAGLAKAVEP
jgi:tetratricopeptide (TPR) repeat protein